MGEYRIGKTFRFSAAHDLAGFVAEGHKCARVHGHNYEVELVVAAGGLDKAGMVVDYAELDRMRAWLNNVLDHRDLNEVFASRGLQLATTAENLALVLWDVARMELRLPTLQEVRVRETPDTWASYGRA